MEPAHGAKFLAPSNRTLSVRFPQRVENEISQDEEWCEVRDYHGTAVTKVRFHDYAHTFNIPGLYNQLFGGVKSETKCVSPQVIAELFKEHLHHLYKNESSATPGRCPNKLRILDFGAGNGMSGEEVRLLVRSHEDKGLADSTVLVGFDILPEARLATERDRPGIDDAYIVADITDYIKGPRTELESISLYEFDVLVSASALGSGHASATALKAAISCVRNEGLVLFNYSSTKLLDHKGSRSHAPHNQGTGSVSSDTADTAFFEFIQQSVDEGRMEVLARKTYCHRFSVTGKPYFYVAVVAIKHANLV
ncbi:hypothetical protein diail_10018 [Diaporthe ilicicola]|nr:hypothetical protein diail_10018 [Diaporthe ilicicola]